MAVRPLAQGGARGAGNRALSLPQSFARVCPHLASLAGGWSGADRRAPSGRKRPSQRAPSPPDARRPRRPCR
ncbi:hypothetical protein SCOCK_710025 [Actinacidiphila cocklensis]|uniref:Uncharacterized protein n=1 Tax=Actinacidiphila cocklensis TaxID=887465 RepID=A0A9W4E386_9ACTN|nr:hypothetical protein SCOCK_710025 [Actinacidiphila cocklensis]